MSASLRLLLLAPLLLTIACGVVTDENEEIDIGLPIEDSDWERIVERDTLTLLTTYNSTSYFLYRGVPLGYEYEMAQKFAEDNDLALKTIVVPNRDSLFVLLNQGVGDLAAARIVPRAIDSTRLAFSRPLYETPPVLVQLETPPDQAAIPETLDTLLEAKTDSLFGPIPENVEAPVRLVRRPAGLAASDDSVYIADRTAYEDRLIELSDSLGNVIEVVEIEGDVSIERLVRAVARGNIRFTVAPQNIAELKESYFTNIAIVPILDEPYRVSWAMRSNTPILSERINAWIAENEDSAFFNQLYTKYFVDRQGYRERTESEYLTSETGRLSDYDDILRRNAPAIGWDWRLLAAQAYQESRFINRARSWAGAAGLLQLMPPTAREFGVDDVYDPEQNVAGAVRFIEWLENYWVDKILDDSERLKFVLASYNTGHGHVEDARRLTAKNGGDDTVWEDVSYWLLQKSKPAVYRDPVVKYGYSRGIEPVLYVEHILDRFEHYRQFVDPYESVGTTAANTRTPAPATD
jgi:membrane-bound lytic murein transglycosylase F